MTTFIASATPTVALATGMFERSIAKQSKGWVDKKSARSGESISPHMDGAMT
jgi:hypothetical protein